MYKKRLLWKAGRIIISVWFDKNFFALFLKTLPSPINLSTAFSTSLSSISFMLFTLYTMPEMYLRGASRLTATVGSWTFLAQASAVGRIHEKYYIPEKKNWTVFQRELERKQHANRSARSFGANFGLCEMHIRALPEQVALSSFFYTTRKYKVQSK